MKRLLLILACVLGTGVLAYVAGYCWRVRTVTAQHTDLDGLLWVRAEYQLTDEQFAQVKALHEAYQPKCDDLCRKAVASEKHVGALIATNRSVTPELQVALQEQARLQSECQASMLSHAYETAAIMKPEQAERYLHFINGCMMHGHGGPHAMMEGKH